MKQIKITLFLSILFCSAIIFNGCKSNTASYCSVATRSRTEDCNIPKDKVLCFKCNGASCPDLTNKQVYIKKGATDSCLVSLGNKITDCAKCAEEDSVVVLLSIKAE